MTLQIWTMTYEGEIIGEQPLKHPHLIRAEMRRAYRAEPRAEMVWAVDERGEPVMMLAPDDDAVANHPDAEKIQFISTETAA